jgi:uncharacterized protein with ATP-grasp and redox domains
MEFKYDCLHCHINQGIKVSDFLELDSNTKEMIIKETMLTLSNADFNKQTPELMATTWDTITSLSGNNDPYKEFKYEYNKIMLKIEKPLVELINKQSSPFNSYLYSSILGNIIDLGPSHEFEKDNWLPLFEKELQQIDLAINDSDELFNALKNATNLLYIGDNCGEIVLDKLFVSYIKSVFPDLSITFSVRGKPVLNDATLIDANQIGLTKIVNTISNGEDTPGLILEKTSDEFKNYYNTADVIIAKGQGNYEGLSDIHDSRIFHLLIVKCPIIATETGVPNMSKVCLRQEN